MLSAGQLFLATAFAGLATQASPISPISSISKRALKEYDQNVQLHESCQGSQREQLVKAFEEVVNITTFARDYVATNGPEDDLYVKWFGEGDYISVIGALDALLYSNKINVTFRCDDPDGNCSQDGWAGHYRGSNATQETVICDLSYEIREPLSNFCEGNYTVAESSPSYYWATDLVHRLYHVPSIADGEVGHVADSYADCLELAYHNASWTPYNTHTLQYFMAEAYANEVARPGEGCTGTEPELEHDHDDDHEEETSSDSDTSAGDNCRATSFGFYLSTGLTLLLFRHAF